MRILVTGANGFAGVHLCHELHEHGHEVLGIGLEPPARKVPCETLICDILDTDSLTATLNNFQPDGCIHLAGMAFVPVSWERPQQVYEVNTLGTVGVIECCHRVNPQMRLLVITSSEVYGRICPDHPINEDAPLMASNPYAVSKIAADTHALLFSAKTGMPVMTARPQNHIGPGQTESFVVPSFARQCADIARDQAEASISVGNLESERDFLDVRDVVSAYRLLLEKGEPGKAYNIARGRLDKIQHVLDLLCEIAGIQPEIMIDKDLYRPADRPAMLDTARLQSTTGWTPQYQLRDTLHDIYHHILGE